MKKFKDFSEKDKIFHLQLTLLTFITFFIIGESLSRGGISWILDSSVPLKHLIAALVLILYVSIWFLTIPFVIYGLGGLTFFIGEEFEKYSRSLGYSIGVWIGDKTVLLLNWFDRNSKYVVSIITILVIISSIILFVILLNYDLKKILIGLIPILISILLSRLIRKK